MPAAALCDRSSAGPARVRALFARIDAGRTPDIRWGHDPVQEQSILLRDASWRRVSWMLRELDRLARPAARSSKWWWTSGLAAAGTGLCLLHLPFDIGSAGPLVLLAAIASAAAGQRPSSPATAEFAAWEQHYREAYCQLCATSLPLLILDADMWRNLYHDNLPAVTRPLVPGPRNLHDCLLHAVACWPVLECYAGGARAGLGRELLECQPRLVKLRSGRWSFPTELGIAARHAAIYDFFHGPQAELDGPSLH